ncbi:MAG: Nif11-like leader peptide family natural product precursor [Proteobacteria bacterium]|nr:Nif11-like leader peptide family natural product precursor [Pseudomonadota bacterium]
MSHAAVNAFLERMGADETFRTKIMALENANERIKLINAEGFDCTIEEIGEQATEISEEELAMVVGGSQNCQANFAQWN